MTTENTWMCFRTPDDEHEIIPLWEIARKDRRDALRQREAAGEDVRAENATEDFFEDLGKALWEKRGSHVSG